MLSNNQKSLFLQGFMLPKYLPPLPSDVSTQALGAHYHSVTPQSTHGAFDLQASSSGYDAMGRGGGINNKGFPDVDRNNAGSSSTGSNNVGSTSKITSGAAAASASGTTNVVYEVHDWWTEQVNSRQSSDEEDE